MRLLAINQFYWPDPAPTSQLLTDVCEHMAGRGHDVHVVAGRDSYVEGGGGLLRTEEQHGGVHIHRVSGTHLGKASVVRRGVDAVSFQGWALARCMAVERPDVILCKSTPPLLASVGMLARRFHGARFVYWVQDLYPDVALALGAVAPDSVAVRAARRVAETVVTDADVVVALGPVMAERLVAHGAEPSRIHVVDNWQDGSHVRPWTGGEHPMRASWGNTGALCVMYSGNFGLAHDADTLRDALLRTRADHGLDFVFVGEGARKQPFRAALAEAGIRHARFLPLFPRESVGLSLTAPDVHLVTLHPALGGMVVPSKVYGVMAAGIPALYIGPRHSEAWDILARHGAGVCVENGDVEGVLAALHRLRDEPAERVAMGRRGRAAFEAHYDRPHALQRFTDLLEHVP